MKKKLMFLTMILMMVVISIACCVGCKNAEGSGGGESGGTATAPDHKHAYGAWTVVEQPTCTTFGKRKHTCTICNKEHVDFIPMLPHAFANEWTVDIAPTDTVVGSESRHCTAHGCHATTDARTICIATDGLSYKLLADDTYEITGIGTSKKSILFLPTEYNGKKVSSIAERAFVGATIVSVKIPNNITNIGAEAFYNCRELEKVEISSSVVNMGVNAFFECARALIYCEFEIKPEGWVADWDKRTEVFLNKTYVPTIWDCKKSKLASDGKIYDIVDGIMYEFSCELGQNKAVVSYQTRKIVTANIPTKITYDKIEYEVVSIKESAFDECKDLTNVTFQNGIIEIGDYAFNNCIKLGNIVLPGTLITIGESAFSMCNEFTHCTIPNNVKNIGWGAFSQCMNLLDMTIPKSVEIIDTYAFLQCDLLIIRCEGKNAGVNWKSDWSDRQPIIWDCTKNDVANDKNIYATIEGLRYALKNGEAGKAGEATVYKQTLKIESANIPLAVKYKSETYAVTSIGGYAFCNCKNLKSIVLPDSLKSLQTRAFMGCINLTSIVIPNQVTAIDDSVFLECNGIESIIIPDSVVTVGSFAFSDCASLKNVKIGKGLKVINEQVFLRCTSLTNIIIPDNITTIGQFAFFECSNLQNVQIGTGVTEIGYSAFSNCISLAILIIPMTVNVVCDYAFSGCKALTIYYGWSIGSHPRGWQPLWNNSFRPIVGNCENFTKGMQYALQADDTYKLVGIGSAIETSIIIPGIYNNRRVSAVGNGAFKNNPNLTSINFQCGISAIEAFAFEGCSKLKNITIPTSVTIIGDGVFKDCIGLASIVVVDGNTKYRSENHCIIEKATNTLVLGCKTTVIPSSVTAIGNNAFAGCSGLTSITIPSSLTAIGDGAFSGCGGLVDINFSKGLKSIGNNAFTNCAFTCVAIPNGVTYIGNNAFGNIAALTIYCELISQPSSWNGNWNGNSTIVWHCGGSSGLSLQLSADGAYYIVVGIGTATDNQIIIPTIYQGQLVKNICNNAFECCSGLTSITIPSSVMGIGEYAFSGCSKLTINFEAKSLPINLSANWNSDNCPVVLNCKNNDIATDGFIHTYFDGIRYALKDGKAMVVRQSKNVTTANISSNILYKGVSYSVTSIGNSAFSGCSGLTSVTLPTTGLTTIGDVAFAGCSGLTGVILPSSVTAIGDAAFYNCIGLTNISIPNGVIRIYNNAFAGCSGLTGVTLPTSVTAIGGAAFYNCIGLTNITIPSSVTSIGDSAFSGCSKLTINFEAKRLPANLSYGWNSDNCPVVLNCKNNDTATDDFIYTYFDGIIYALKDGIASVLRQLTNITIANIQSSILYRGNIYAVTSIDNNAFDGCSGLTSVTIPSGITIIGNEVFYGSSGLTIYCEAASLPATLGTNWNREDFPIVLNCKNNEIAIDGFIYKYFDGIKYALKDGIASVARQSKNVTNANISSSILHKGVSYSVTRIGYNAFKGSGLTSITIPSSVTVIESGAFYGCSGLTGVTIPSSVTDIYGYAFYGCSGLTNIIIPSGLRSIGSAAFENCSGLTSITIPSGVTSMQNGTFGGCHSLLINFEATTLPRRSGGIGVADKWRGDNCLVVLDCKNNDIATDGFIYTYFDGIRYALKDGIASVVRQSTNITIANIPTRILYKGVTYTVKSIGEIAFADCSGLTSITIPSSVTSIGNRAFYGCDGLTSITIPSSVTAIGDSAFFGCSGLTINCEATSSPTTFVSGWNCSCPIILNCKNNEIATDGFIYKYFDGIKYALKNGEAMVLRQLKNITIANIPTSVSYKGITYAVTSIVDRAFEDCKGLISVTIPSSVTAIGDRAFFGCDNLIIECAEGSKPTGWNVNWNSNRPVVWGYTGK